MAAKRILVVDDDENFRQMACLLLKKEGYAVTAASDASEALQAASIGEFDLILSDVRMPAMDGLELLQRLQAQGAAAPVILMSAYGDTELALEGIRIGAYDYISKQNYAEAELLLRLKITEERDRLRRENLNLRKQVLRSFGFENIVTKNPRMLQIFQTMDKVAEYRSTVLLTGESGSGKELLAMALHHKSPRASMPFVTVNCAAIPENLLESELFGYLKGAFTDAKRDKRGLFEEAHGGTLFLDEIGDLPLSLQVKLLRVLQDGEIRRLGGITPIVVDVRIVTATDRDLAEEVKKKTFRPELYYRLNVISINIPPLRERKEDIADLVSHFIARFNAKLNKQITSVDPEVMKIFFDYDWPGNVRELENVIERGMILTEGPAILASNLPEKLFQEAPRLKKSLIADELSIKKSTRSLEDELIRAALIKTRGNRTRAAELLEISHRALIYKIKEYGISVEALAAGEDAQA